MGDRDDDAGGEWRGGLLRHRWLRGRLGRAGAGVAAVYEQLYLPGSLAARQAVHEERRRLAPAPVPGDPPASSSPTAVPQPPDLALSS